MVHSTASSTLALYIRVGERLPSALWLRLGERKWRVERTLADTGSLKPRAPVSDKERRDFEEVGAMVRWIATAAATWALLACAAAPVSDRGTRVQVVTSQPKGQCRYLGEAVGSQGNLWTGDYTPDANMMVGARNRLRNEAAEMGGNVVWMQQTSSRGTSMNIGMSNATVLGNVYRCASGENSREDAAAVQPRGRM